MADSNAPGSAIAGTHDDKGTAIAGGNAGSGGELDPDGTTNRLRQEVWIGEIAAIAGLCEPQKQWPAVDDFSHVHERVVLAIESDADPPEGTITFAESEGPEVSFSDAACVTEQPSRGGRYRFLRALLSKSRLRFDIVPAEALDPVCFEDELQCRLPALSYTIDLAIIGDQMQGLGQGRDEIRLKRCGTGCLQ